MRLSALLAVAAVAAAAHLVGHSVQGRRIVAYEVGDPAAARKVLVVGCLHGNECAGIAVVNRLRRLGPLEGVDLWLVPDANPDGHRARTRGNAHGVDLNRNFPHRWKRLRGLFYSGPRPASEPETQTMMTWSRAERFAKVIGADPARVDLTDQPRNESLGVREAELLRRFNARLGDKFPLPSPYIENIGVRPDIVADYMTRTNLITGGAPFVQAFTQKAVSLAQ